MMLPDKPGWWYYKASDIPVTARFVVYDYDTRKLVALLFDHHSSIIYSQEISDDTKKHWGKFYHVSLIPTERYPDGYIEELGRLGHRFSEEVSKETFEEPKLFFWKE